MDRLLQEGIVLRDVLSFLELHDEESELVRVSLSGRLPCAANVLVRVDKKLMVRRGVGNRYEVRTEHYQYHAWVRSGPGRPRRDLIRYDNAHEGRLHVHRFDTDGFEWRVQPIALDDMPTLDVFVRHAVDLGSPNSGLEIPG